MRQTYLCKNLGVEERGGHIFEGGLSAGEYSTYSLHSCYRHPLNNSSSLLVISGPLLMECNHYDAIVLMFWTRERASMFNARNGYDVLFLWN